MKRRESPLFTVIFFGLLFIFAFVLSGYWILFNPQQPLPDPTLYEGIGANLAAGNGFSFDRTPPFRPELTRTPILPCLIALLYTIMGRAPLAVLWMNAVFIGLSVALGYLITLRLFRDQRIAVLGGIIALLTPPVTGCANNILTEPLAMLQIGCAVLLLLGWKKRAGERTAPFHAALLGLLLASLVLNRTSMTILALLGGAYVVIVCQHGRWRSTSAWLSTLAFSLTLGTPVLMWSARNASLDLPFSPAPIGVAASRVFDIKRYKEYLLDPGEKLPVANARYFLHWKFHYGPLELQALEQQNKQWFDKWYAAHSDRVWKAMPHRFIGLFSFFRNTIFPPWPLNKDQEMRDVMRVISRTLWLTSFLGLILFWNNKAARAIWLAAVVPLVVVHLLTVCHDRYLFPLLPLLMPYCGAALIGFSDRLRHRLL